MYIVLLKFSDNKSQAGQFMEGHKNWLDRGFEDGVFLLAGSLAPSAGGGILADTATLAELEMRLNEDPFVVENVVKAEIIEIAPSRSDARLSFLVG